MEKPLISVIVPVYKSEPYLRKCVDSILAQTYTNIEVILVDDGSPDGCPAICDEYAARDKRVRVIHQQNGGISKARNAGLVVMSGIFVAFVDSDDVIKPDFLEKMSGSMEDADIVACGYGVFSSDTDSAVFHDCKEFELCGNELIKQAYTQKQMGNFFTPWAKLYRVSGEKSIFFDESLCVGEDIVFNIDFLSRAEKVKRIHYAGYFLRMHPDSTTNRLELAYTPLYEHSYTHISDAKIAAKKRWGIDTAALEQEINRDNANRYFHEVCNIFSVNSPYNGFNSKIKAIKEIHNDTDMRHRIQQNSFSSISSIGKISFICAKLQNAYFTYFVFGLVCVYRRLRSK